MKRKKWSELEELTLLDKYSDLSSSGTLHKLKTREKKFKPIADHVNSVHHSQDPLTFPFKWSWRDVSIKVQNMRHQYLGVKQKIRVSQDEFNWDDAENHWKNFLRYKEVFGDVELEVKGKKLVDAGSGSDLFRSCLGFDSSGSENYFEEEEEDEEEEVVEEMVEGDSGEMGTSRMVKREAGLSRRLGLLGAQVMDLRNVMVGRERKRREREFDRENCELECEGRRRELELQREIRLSERDERVEDWEMSLEQREMLWARREFERRMRLEQELDEERMKRRMVEEKREEEEMEWRERMVGMQIEHEKAMMQLQAEACQNQMQILSLMARLICQFFGSANDGLGGGLGGLPPQDLPHPGGLDDSGENRLVGLRPVVIFSKTSCCMSHSIKLLICRFGANPMVHELEKILNGKQIDKALIQLGCQQSRPAVFIGQKLIGWGKGRLGVCVLRTNWPQCSWKLDPFGIRCSSQLK